MVNATTGSGISKVDLDEGAVSQVIIHYSEQVVKLQKEIETLEARKAEVERHITSQEASLIKLGVTASEAMTKMEEEQRQQATALDSKTAQLIKAKASVTKAVKELEESQTQYTTKSEALAAVSAGITKREAVIYGKEKLIAQKNSELRSNRVLLKAEKTAVQEEKNRLELQNRELVGAQNDIITRESSNEKATLVLKDMENKVSEDHKDVVRRESDLINLVNQNSRLLENMNLRVAKLTILTNLEMSLKKEIIRHAKDPDKVEALINAQFPDPVAEKSPKAVPKPKAKK